MATTPNAGVVRTITLPLALKDKRPRVSHYHEVRSVDEPHAGAIIVLANSVLELLDTDAKHLPITITATKSKPGLVVEPPIEVPNADEPAKPAKPGDTNA